MQAGHVSLLAYIYAYIRMASDSSNGGNNCCAADACESRKNVDDEES